MTNDTMPENVFVYVTMEIHGVTYYSAHDYPPNDFGSKYTRTDIHDAVVKQRDTLLEVLKRARNGILHPNEYVTEYLATIDNAIANVTKEIQ
jgi:hypothetical protein